MSWNPEELEPVACDFCGQADARLVIKRPDGLQAVECVSCGLCFLSPRPKTHVITRLYEAEYFSKSNPDSAAAKIGYPDYLSEDYRQGMLNTNRVRLQVVLPYIALRGAQCLEIGCATGELCHLLRRHGAQPLGIDLSTHAVEHARRRYPRLKFQTGDLPSLPPERLFDALFAFEVIEHVVSPSQFFAKAERQLKPGGHLVLTTPNYDCGRQLGLERWSGFLTSFEHLYFFSPKSLAAFGQAAELEPRAWFTDRTNGSVVPPPTPKPGLRNALIRGLQRAHLLDAVRNVRDLVQGAPPAIYRPEGAGHNLYMIFQKKAAYSSP